jgi:hypothetical protein
MINFNVTDEDRELIAMIVGRALRNVRANVMTDDETTDRLMDITEKSCEHQVRGNGKLVKL